MGLYKWLFKKINGFVLVDPDPNFVPEENDAEKFLNGNKVWPKKVKGKFFLSDSAGDDKYPFYWVIGELEISNFKNSILLEFKDEILIKSGLSQNEDFPETISVEINPAIEEHYQVVSVINT